MDEIKIEQLPAPQTDTASFDILLWFKETQTELMGRLDYNSDIFEHATMERLMQRIQILFATVVKNAELSIYSIPIMTDEEQRRLHNARDTVKASRNNYVAPGNEAEEYVASLWSELLGKDRIGIFDNFFEIGGYSLLAVEMFSRIQKKFRLNLPLATLFSAPTIKEIALLLQDHLVPSAKFPTVKPLPFQKTPGTMRCRSNRREICRHFFVFTALAAMSLIIHDWLLSSVKNNPFMDYSAEASTA